jgi:hypothetical protein
MGTTGIWGYFNFFTYILLCHPCGYPPVSSIKTLNYEVVLYDTDNFKPLFETRVEGVVDFDKANFMGIL